MTSKQALPVPADELTAAAKRRAADAIQRIHELFYVKGGIRDTAEKLHDKQHAAGQIIYGLAKYAAEAETKPVKQMALFRGMCRFAESGYKQEYKVSNLADALPVWRVYKANILKGVRLGFDPKDFKTEYELRKAVQEELAGDDDDSPQQRQLGAQKLPNLPAKLQPLFARAMDKVQHMDKEHKKTAADILRKALQEIDAMSGKD